MTSYRYRLLSREQVSGQTVYRAQIVIRARCAVSDEFHAFLVVVSARRAKHGLHRSHGAELAVRASSAGSLAPQFLVFPAWTRILLIVFHPKLRTYVTWRTRYRGCTTFGTVVPLRADLTRGSRGPRIQRLIGTCGARILSGARSESWTVVARFTLLFRSVGSLAVVALLALSAGLTSCLGAGGLLGIETWGTSPHAEDGVSLVNVVAPEALRTDEAAATLRRRLAYQANHSGQAFLAAKKTRICYCSTV